MTPQANNRQQLLSRVEEGFQPIEKLHQEVQSAQTIEGVDSTVFSNVQESINTAYESLNEARQMLASTS